MELLACVLPGVKLMVFMQRAKARFHEYSLLNLKLMISFFIYDRNIFPHAPTKIVIIMFEN
jgi:hypothetical protein